MITDTSLDQLAFFLRRIFLLKIGRSTIREVQNALMASTQGDQEIAKDLFQTLISGNLTPGFATNPLSTKLKALVAEYTLPIRMAQDAFERGEFVGLVVSDLLTMEQQSAFMHRIRRLDGEEFSFMTDPQSTVHLLQHFAQRMDELSTAPGGKEAIKAMRNDLQEVKSRLDALLK